MAWGWNEVSFKVPPKPKLPVILQFSESVVFPD